MGKPNHTLEFRIAVVKFYLSGQGGMKRTAAHFGIHKSTVSHWVASWQMHGIDGITWKVAEITHLKAWKKYRVALSRLDLSAAPDIDWPKSPV